MTWQVDSGWPCAAAATAAVLALTHWYLFHRAAAFGADTTANVVTTQFSKVPQIAVANSGETDGRIAIWYHRMANLTVYLLKVSNSRRVDRHLRYSGKLRSITTGAMYTLDY
jgi:hypothetical protein